MNAVPYPSTPSSRCLLRAQKNFAPHFRRAPRRPAVFEPVFQAYLAFLARAQGLAPSTLGHHRLHASAFLEYLGRARCLVWTDLSPSHVDRFTRHYVIRFRRRYRATVLYVLRRFLRYLYFRGLISRPLDALMLMVRTFQHERLPRYLKADEIQRLLSVIDRGTPMGRRDYAAVVLLLGTGLRAGELMRLTLDDVNWRCRHLFQPRRSSEQSKSLTVFLLEQVLGHHGPGCAL